MTQLRDGFMSINVIHSFAKISLQMERSQPSITQEDVKKVHDLELQKKRGSVGKIVEDTAKLDAKIKVFL